MAQEYHCKDCRFCAKPPVPENRMWICRESPPTVIVSRSLQSTSDGRGATWIGSKVRTVWPLVDPDNDWCGAFEAAEQ